MRKSFQFTVSRSYNVFEIDKILQIHQIVPPSRATVVDNFRHITVPEGSVKHHRHQTAEQEKDRQLGSESQVAQHKVGTSGELVKLSICELERDVGGEKATHVVEGLHCEGSLEQELECY